MLIVPEHLRPLLELALIALGMGIFILYFAHRRNQFKPNQAYLYLNQGQKKHASDDLEGAEQEYNEALKIDPRLGSAYLARADLYFKLGRFDEAIADLDQAIVLAPRSEQAYFMRAQTFLANKRFDEAIRDYTHILSLPIDRTWRVAVYNRRGFAKVTKANFDLNILSPEDVANANDALQDFDSALQLDPRNTYSLLERGKVYLQIRDFDAAIRDFTEGIRLAPQTAEFYLRRAFVYRRLEDFEKALADYDRTIILTNGTNASIYNERAITRQLNGDTEGALSDCDKAAQIDPRNPIVVQTRAVIQTEQKSWDAAIRNFTQAIALNHPRLYLPYFYRAYVYFEQGNLEMAQADVTESIRLNPKLGEAYNNRGYQYGLLGDFEKALTDCNHAIALEPTLTSAYGSRGHTYFLMGRFDDALADFQKQLDLESNHKFGLAGSAIIQHTFSHMDEAKALWSSLRQLDSEYINPDKLQEEYHCADAFLEAARKVAAL